MSVPSFKYKCDFASVRIFFRSIQGVLRTTENEFIRMKIRTDAIYCAKEYSIRGMNSLYISQRNEFFFMKWFFSKTDFDPFTNEDLQNLATKVGPANETFGSVHHYEKIDLSSNCFLQRHHPFNFRNFQRKIDEKVN